MDILEAIRTRRSVRKVKDEIPPKEAILTLLDAARRAPNHFNTEPWHFFVLTGEGRTKLGKVYGKINQNGLENPDQEALDSAMEKGIAQAKRSPVVIVVTIEPSENPKVKKVEEIAATACAVENMLLTAHALGLGAIWRTGDPSYTDLMKQGFSVSDDGLVLGYLYVGYPAEDLNLKAPVRKSAEEIATWVED
ncbi:nitroreductase family protein [Sporolactobacillus pectinivorans]|uniref:nitroreductase family protein n=1 Tax=Sporolactobacillus pectinivorans TaxID=1591408 RepID=UPI000C2666DB|nr:nitroreductase [Sporolactobacillus pectinivorans]